MVAMVAMSQYGSESESESNPTPAGECRATAIDQVAVQRVTLVRNVLIGSILGLAASGEAHIVADDWVWSWGYKIPNFNSGWAAHVHVICDVYSATDEW
jgi:hypothetical protein